MTMTHRPLYPFTNRLTRVTHEVTVAAHTHTQTHNKDIAPHTCISYYGKKKKKTRKETNIQAINYDDGKEEPSINNIYRVIHYIAWYVRFKR